MDTILEVAEWMLEELKREKYLHQEQVVYDIETKFGGEFTYINEYGNPAIDKRVLQVFRNLTEYSVVWESGEKLWRFREDHDPPGRDADAY